MNVSNDLRNHWENLLRPVFPAGARFDIDANASDFRAKVRWQVGTDPSRPHKMSKTIFVVVPVETASEYENKTDAQRQADDGKLRDFVESKLASHDPDHDNPKDVIPPEVEWVADSNVLNS